MKRFLAAFITIALMLVLFPFGSDVKAAGLISKKFDLGGKGAATGYIGVSAKEGYDKTKGYGFGQLNLAEDVDAKGKGALSDAVRFKGGNGNFKVDLPTGVYKITVTTGNDTSSTIVAEGVNQLYFLTGNNAVDSFTIPVTDGQLNIYATSGVGDFHSISTIEIEQTSTGTTTKPTIWICGDSTVASYYNVGEDAKRGWGEYLSKYVDTDKYDIRNISASGLTSASLIKSLYPTVEAYAKKGDIILFSVGINDYTAEYRAHKDAIDPTNYINNMTYLVDNAKSKGMTVYLVKQHGNLEDCHKYPLPQYAWFGKELDSLASSKKVGTIDLFSPWLVLCLEKTSLIADQYYSEGIHLNAEGSDILAQMVADQLFPSGSSGYTYVDPYPEFEGIVGYEAEVSGEIITNPHKGYVMEVHNPAMLYSGGHPLGIDGSKNNHAWDVISTCCSVIYWEDLNPAEGEYNWDLIDNMLEACEQAGLTYAIRIIPYSTATGSDDNYGESHDFVPQWVYNKGAKKDITKYKYKDNSPEIKVPNWSDPIYIQAYKDLMTAIAERYDNDPRVEYIEIRAFGNMGEWHCSEFTNNFLPSVEIQKDMLDHYKKVFKNTPCSVFVDARGEIYDYSVSLGFAKRNDGLIMAKNSEWELVPAYEANVMTMGDNHNTYETMLKQDGSTYLKWTREHYRECIEISHLTFMAIDQDSGCGYKIYSEQQDLIDEMCNRLGYDLTVTSAERNGNQLKVTIKNIGLAPAFFNIQLAAEITDENGNKIENFGSPVLIENGTFRDGTSQTFLFTYDGTLDENATICLAMYDVSKPLKNNGDPQVRFDNKNNLPNNRLKLIVSWTSPENSSSSTPSSIPSTTNTPGKTPGSTPGKTPSKTPGNNPGKTPVSGSSNEQGTVVTFEDFVERLYVVALNRASEPEGKAFWCEHVGNGDLTGAECANEFLLSKEFNDRNLSDEDFLKVLYKTFFDRDAANDPDGFNFWMNSLKTEGRDKVVDGFINSTEWCNICATYGVKSGATRAKATVASANAIAFAERLYTKCLGRDAETEGLNFWSLGLTNLELTGSEAAHEFFFSKEFNDHNFDNKELLTRMYRTFMGREPDDDGMNFWLDSMKNGMTKEQVFDNFVNSAEFTQICKDYAIDRG